MRISEYVKLDSLKDSDIYLVDTDSGTYRVEGGVLKKYIVGTAEGNITELEKNLQIVSSTVADHTVKLTALTDDYNTHKQIANSNFEMLEDVKDDVDNTLIPGFNNLNTSLSETQSDLEQLTNRFNDLPSYLFPAGSVLFEELPALADVQVGATYNITNDFTTTANFREGAGKEYPAGTNLYKAHDGKWDCFAGIESPGVFNDITKAVDVSSLPAASADNAGKIYILTSRSRNTDQKILNVPKNTYIDANNLVVSIALSSAVGIYKWFLITNSIHGTYDPSLHSTTYVLSADGSSRLYIEDTNNHTRRRIYYQVVNVSGNVNLGLQLDMNTGFNMPQLSYASPFRFGRDADGNYGYYKDGADTVTPFKSDSTPNFGDLFANEAASADFSDTPILGELANFNIECSREYQLFFISDLNGSNKLSAGGNIRIYYANRSTGTKTYTNVPYVKLEVGEATDGEPEIMSYLSEVLNVPVYNISYADVITSSSYVIGLSSSILNLHLIHGFICSVYDIDVSTAHYAFI